jgi:hypothetical protein
LERFLAAVGIGKIVDSHPPSHKGYKAQFVWRISKGSEVQKVAALFRPFLSPRRLAQFDATLARRALTDHLKQARHARYVKQAMVERDTR